MHVGELEVNSRLSFRLLVAAFALVIVAFVLLAWAAWHTWPPTDGQAIAQVAAWIAGVGVLATVLSIVAAYVELRTLFPHQRLQVRVERRPLPDWDMEICRTVFSNPKNGALVNAYRLEVWLEDPQGRMQSYYGDRPSQSSGAAAGWKRAPSEESNDHSYHWTLLQDEPFFPGTDVEGPYVDLWPDTVDDRGRWRAVWHTDRNASGDTPLTLDIPSSASE